MPALPPYIIEPIWQQFCALLPEREMTHPLSCHRPHVPDRIILEKLIQILVFGCAYRSIADSSCSATTLRERRSCGRVMQQGRVGNASLLSTLPCCIGLVRADRATNAASPNAPFVPHYDSGAGSRQKPTS